MTSPTDRRRILVVDDIELNRMLVAAVLGDQFEVDTASGGLAALSAMDSTDYDLVLMDLNMPDFSGFDTAASFRQRPHGHSGDALIVALSTARDADTVRRTRDCGMNGHIGRPIGPLDLKRQIKEFLEQHAVASKPEIWHRDRYDELVDRFGTARAATFLVGLLAKIDETKALLAPGTLLTAALKWQLHDLASVSGMLGFDEVFLLCRTLQGDVLADAPELGRLPAALDRASLVIAAEVSEKH